MSNDVYLPFDIKETSEINLNYQTLTTERTHGKIVILIE